MATLPAQIAATAVVVSGLENSALTRDSYPGGQPHRRRLAGARNTRKMAVAVETSEKNLPLSCYCGNIGAKVGPESIVCWKVATMMSVWWPRGG